MEVPISELRESNLCRPERVITACPCRHFILKSMKGTLIHRHACHADRTDVVGRRTSLRPRAYNPKRKDASLCSFKGVWRLWVPTAVPSAHLHPRPPLSQSNMLSPPGLWPTPVAIATPACLPENMSCMLSGSQMLVGCLLASLALPPSSSLCLFLAHSLL